MNLLTIGNKVSWDSKDLAVVQAYWMNMKTEPSHAIYHTATNVMSKICNELLAVLESTENVVNHTRTTTISSTGASNYKVNDDFRLDFLSFAESNSTVSIRDCEMKSTQKTMYDDEQDPENYGIYVLTLPLNLKLSLLETYESKFMAIKCPERPDTSENYCDIVGIGSTNDWHL